MIGEFGGRAMVVPGQHSYEPREKPAVPWVAYPTLMASDAYYYFVAEVAKGIRAARPKVRIQALAYANVHSPPRKIDRLPDNVMVEVCQYGAPTCPCVRRPTRR